MHLLAVAEYFVLIVAAQGIAETIFFFTVHAVYPVSAKLVYGRVCKQAEIHSEQQGDYTRKFLVAATIAVLLKRVVEQFMRGVYAGNSNSAVFYNYFINGEAAYIIHIFI